jgi:hypothetical protein
LPQIVSFVPEETAPPAVSAGELALQYHHSASHSEDDLDALQVDTQFLETPDAPQLGEVCMCQRLVYELPLDAFLNELVRKTRSLDSQGHAEVGCGLTSFAHEPLHLLGQFGGLAQFFEQFLLSL